MAVGVGMTVLSQLLKPRAKDSFNFGPRLSDLNVPTVSPGNEIPRVWGTIKIPTQNFWTSRLIETMHIGAQKAPGGKGGKHQSITYTTSYTYSVNAAMGICRGPIAQVNRIWAQSKLLWTNPNISAADQQAAFDAAYMSEGNRLYDLGVAVEEASVSAYIFAYNNYAKGATLSYFTTVSARYYIIAHPLFVGASPNITQVNLMLTAMFDSVGLDKNYVPNLIRFDSIVIYNGDEFQEPDPTMQAALGVANVPGYRGLAYFVINNLQLADFGNSVPTFTVEVCKDGVVSIENVTTTQYVPYGGSGDMISSAVTTPQVNVQPAYPTLGTIISGILSDCGLPADSYDTSTALPGTLTVSGYAITANTSTRQLLQDLQKIFCFDGCESGWQIKFKEVNSRPTSILRRADLGAHQDKDDLPPSIEFHRQSELDMPRRLNFKYQEPARNYSANTVWAMRQINNSLSVEDIDMAIALDRDVAKQYVEKALVQRFLSRNTYKVHLPRKYIVYEPGDVTLIEEKEYPNQYQAWRVTSMAIGANGMLEVTFCDSNFLESAIPPIIGTDIDVTQPNLPSNSRTYAYMLDTPLLSDAIPDVPQFFVVLSGVTQGWKAGGLLVDLSDPGMISAYGDTAAAPTAGSNWFSAATSNVRVPHGYAMVTLDPTVKAGSWDFKSEVIVYLIDNTWVLSNADPVDMMTQPLNTCWLGGELCAFANATSLGNGKWKLTRWLRGLRGTDYAIPNHTGVEKFVRLNLDSIQSVAQTVAALNKPATFEALSAGEVIGDEPTFTFTNTGNSLRPYAPAITDIYKDESGNFTVNWQPRNRINGAWLSGGDVVLDQAVEAYEIDVVTVVSGSDVVHHTYSLGAVRTWAYSAAAQVSDTGGTTGIFLNIYQIGAIIGRGFVSRVAI
jgi:hypothetical protein